MASNTSSTITNSPVRALLLALLLLGASLRVGAQPFVEFQRGDFPLILSAPHGGYLTPDSLADRTCSACVTVRDSRTQEWARLMADDIEQRTGRRPWVVINLLARVKLDANRDVGEAADGDPHAAEAWQTYHSALEDASNEITRRFGSGLLLDLHGHGHAIQRFELGYLLTASQLRESDAAMEVRAGLSSIRALHSRSGVAFGSIVRGPDSFGDALFREGILSTPSPADPAPLSGQAFFSGGYITARHGSRDGGTVDAIQLEAHYPGMRDSDFHVAELASRVGGAALAFLERWYPSAIGTDTESQPDKAGPARCLIATPAGIRLNATCPVGRVEVVDILGRRVLAIRMAPGEEWIPSSLARGLYLARFEHAPAALRFFR